MPKELFSGGIIKKDGDVLQAGDVNALSTFGDGSDGSYTSGDNLQPGKVYNFTDLTLNSGDTLSSTASNTGEPIIVKVQGNVDISGTIDLKGLGYAGGSAGSGQGSPGNGYGSVQGGSYIFPAFQNQNVVPVTLGSPGTQGKVNDGQASDNQYGFGGLAYPEEEFLKAAYGSIKAFSGTGGGGGSAADGDQAGRGGGGGSSYGSDGLNGSDGGSLSAADGSLGNGGAGGTGGASMIIICAGDFSFTGTIDIQGNDGAGGEDVTSVNESLGGGGGGGGGGGMFYALYNGALTDSGTKLASGGAGGAGGNGSGADGGPGGNGANGTILFESV